MNEKINQLKTERSNIATKIANLQTKATADKKLSAEDNTKIDNYLNRVAEIDTTLNREKRLAELHASNANANPNLEIPEQDYAQKREFASEFERKIANSETATPAEIARLAMEVRLRGCSQERLALTALNSLSSNSKLVKAVNARPRSDLNVGTPAEGGFLVPQELSETINSTRKAFGGLMMHGTTMNSTNGRDLETVVENNTAQKGARIAENAPDTELDPAFAKKVGKAFKYTSKRIIVSYETLDDTGVDLVGFLMRKVSERIGRILADDHINATGASGHPFGLLADAALGKTVANGSPTDFTYDDLVDLVTSVDIAYRRVRTGLDTDGSMRDSGCKFVMNDATLQYIRKIKDTDGRPIFIPSVNQPMLDNLLGYPVVIDQEMPDIGAGLKPIAFGLLTNFEMKNTIQPYYNTIITLRDALYQQNGQVAFSMLTRQSFRLMDTAGESVKVLQLPLL